MLLMLQDVAVPYVFVSSGSGAERSPITEGSVGRLNCVITIATSPGFTRTVSFHPTDSSIRNIALETDKAKIDKLVITVQLGRASRLKPMKRVASEKSG